MSGGGEIAYVTALPDCDICTHLRGERAAAAYDGATIQGPWANMCEADFGRYGVGLGRGRGQRLVVRPAAQDPQDRQDPRYCKHGTFIGGPGGPDYLCGPCEDGL